MTDSSGHEAELKALGQHSHRHSEGAIPGFWGGPFSVVARERHRVPGRCEVLHHMLPWHRPSCPYVGQLTCDLRLHSRRQVLFTRNPTGPTRTGPAECCTSGPKPPVQLHGHAHCPISCTMQPPGRGSISGYGPSRCARPPSIRRSPPSAFLPAPARPAQTTAAVRPGGRTAAARVSRGGRGGLAAAGSGTQPSPINLRISVMSTTSAARSGTVVSGCQRSTSRQVRGRVPEFHASCSKE